MSLEIDDNLEFPDMGDESEQALRDILQYMKHETNKIIPFEEGTLMRSGEVDVERERGTLSYGHGAAAPYAVVQHEDRTLSHDHGRQCKYLERTVKSKQKQAMKYLKDQLGGLF